MNKKQIAELFEHGAIWPQDFPAKYYLFGLLMYQIWGGLRPASCIGPNGRKYIPLFDGWWIYAGKEK